MRRKQLLLLCLTLLTAVGAQAQSQGPIYFQVDGLYYKIFTEYDNYASIVNPLYARAHEEDDAPDTDWYTRTELYIPEEVTYNNRTFPVKVIEEVAFVGCQSIQNVYLANVSTIGTKAFFACSNLHFAIFTNQITNIGEQAFKYSGLMNLNLRDNSVDLSSNLTYIGDQAFYDCPLQYVSMDVPCQTANTIFNTADCDYTFWNGPSSSNYRKLVVNPESGDPIKSISLRNIFEIEASAFAQMSIETLDLGASVGHIGDRAFYQTQFTNQPNFDTSYWLSLGDGAFAYSNLKSIELKYRYMSFGEGVFEHCSNLESVALPSEMTSIPQNMFKSCTSLKTIVSERTTPATADREAFTDIPLSGFQLAIPRSAVANYRTATGWSYFFQNGNYPIANIPVLINYNSPEPYTRTEPLEYADVTYIRNFTNTNWQPFYVPFSLSNVEGYFPEGMGYKVAEINGVHQFDTNGDGEYDETLIEFRTLRSGEIRPNTPYVIKADETGEFRRTWQQEKLYPATNGTVQCSTSRLQYTLTGTYTEITNVEGKYAMKDGSFVAGEQGTHTIKPYRIYLTINEYDGGYGTSAAPAQMPARVRVMVDGEATGIEGISTDFDLGDDRHFNLAGQRVGEGYKGIVIRGGKKFLKR